MSSSSSGLTLRIYLAFLCAAVIPTAIAGLIGIYTSLNTLRSETLGHLEHEVVVRAQGMGRFFDQLAAEVLYLADAPTLEELRRAQANADIHRIQTATSRLERDYTNLARAYPHIYQIRYLDRLGKEVVRVDKKNHKVSIVSPGELQNKGDRYYFKDAFAMKPGELYVSPLDLNVEFGQVEQPERPVIRVATPVANANGQNEGVLIINLHADFLLEQIQQMAQARAGKAYLFDRAGQFISRSGDLDVGFAMKPVQTLSPEMGDTALNSILTQDEGTLSIADSIFAHAMIRFGDVYPIQGRSQWVLAVELPEKTLFMSVLNLYVLYVVLGISLLATAMGGYALSKHLLGPLDALSRETEAIAAGNFSHRVEIHGRDEIASLGQKFNTMAEKVEQLVASLEAHRDRLEQEVQARTADLQREQEERRELDRQVFQLDKMATMGELAMGIAHEMGNPLAGMKAVTQALQYEEDLPVGMPEALRRMENEVDRLSNFLKSFHGFAAPTALNLQNTSLAAAINDVLFWTRKEAKGVGVDFEVHLAQSLPWLRADPAQLKQVLLNLVLNALHAMPQGGKLTIQAEAADAHIRIAIRDTGVGIPDTLLPRIFDPFFTTRPGGSGLGLAITSKIVREHQADIQVESQSGHGTCITLTWPAVAIEQNHPA